MAKTEVVFSHPHDGRRVGESAKLDDAEARRLVRAGIATYAEDEDAKDDSDVSADKPAGRARKRRS